jgi:hypothetical protein
MLIDWIYSTDCDNDMTHFELRAEQHYILDL